MLKAISVLLGESATVIPINCDAKRKKMPNAKDMSRLAAYSPQMAEGAKEWGIVKRKTECLIIAKSFPKKYNYSFARGVIDGDGTIGISKRGYVHCKFVTKSKLFATQFCGLFPDEKIYLYERYGMCYVEVAGGQKPILRFVKKMYKHKGNLFLRRKYEKIQNKIN